MLKAMLPLSSLLGVLYAVPLAVEDAPPRTLRGALDDTVRALDVLRGVETIDVRERDVELVRAATEAPASDPAERLARLDRLRGELTRLENHLELLRSGAAPAFAALPVTPGLVPVPTVGLGDGELARLIEATRTPPPAPEPVAPATPERRTYVPLEPLPTGDTTSSANAPASGSTSGNVLAPPPRDEALAFSKARAAYLAGQFDRALAEFQAGPNDARHRYWRALCLDRLGRAEEALALYDVVIADAEGGEYVQRARSDADFLRWKIQFGAPKPAPAEADASGTPTPTPAPTTGSGN
jgi:tetratricopeptide (TPR) repeat protein